MPPGTRINGVPTRPVGTPDITGWGPSTGLLTEITETVPDLQWPQSVSTFARMRRDPTIAAVLRACFLPIIRATWAVDPEGVSNAEAVDLVASDLGLPVLGEKKKPADSPIRGFRWADHVRLALLNLVFGHYPTEKWFEVRDGRTHLAGWQERPPHTLAFIDVDDDGQIKTVEQNTQTTPIPAKNLVWYANEREGAQWAGVSMLRPCFSAWVLKSETLRVHATSIRRFGVGVPIVHAPAGATPAQIEEARRLATGMRGGDQAGAGLPDGFTFEVAGITGSTPDAVAFLRYLDESISKSALAGYLELGTTTYGSRALGDTMFDAYLLSLQAAADAVGDTATYGDPAMPGISRMLTDVNWGPDEPCPHITCTDVGDRHELTAAAIQQLVACGALQADDELEAFIREAWALPARKTPRTPPPAPPQGRPPGSPQPPGGGGAAPAEPSPGRQPPARQAPAPTPAPGPGPAPAAASARGDGLRRALTPVEAAAGLDPEAIRAELESARDLLLDRWAPVIAAQRRDLAAQVEAAVDEGRIDRLATIAADPGDGTGLLYRAMSTAANKAASRMIGEAAAQGVTIDPKTVSIDEGRLRKIAAARATIAAQALGAAASRRALQVVTASAGADAAQEVTATLAGMSTASLADQLMAAMHAASNEGRFAVLDAGPEAVYTSSEVMDQNTCRPCLSIDGYRFASLADARAAYAAGGYKDCDGGLRCRGTVVASWEEPPPPGTPEAYEQGLYGLLGQHLGPSSWRDIGLAGSAGEDDPKAAGRWSPAEHPRDGRGRFARKAGPDYLPPPRMIARTPPGQLDLWHHTTPRAARDIYRTGTWESQAQGRVYGSTVPFGVGGYGKAAVHIRVPASMARLEDTLPAGERHYSVPAAGLTPEHLRDLYSGSDEEQWWAEWRRRAGYVSGAWREDLHPRDRRGRFGRKGPAALSPVYNEIPETRGPSRTKGIYHGPTGRDLEDAARRGGQIRQIAEPITAKEARGNSRAVTYAEFQDLARRGVNQLGMLRAQRSPITGLDKNWAAVKAGAYAETRKSWGGATIDAHTGTPLATDADKYALSVKKAGMLPVSIPENASRAQFDAAMDRALAEFRGLLEARQSYLGVFHDDEEHRIDIDPVLVVDTPAEVEAIGAYTHAIGGAYHFRTGYGYFPPHVTEEAQVAAAGGETVHWEGPGQWRTSADRTQPGLSDEQDAEIDQAGK